jgi:hypothetical protein
VSKVTPFQTIPYVGFFLSTILSKITIYGLLALPFQTALIRFSPFFSISFGVKIFIFVFLNFVFFTSFTNFSGVRSFEGVSHKSLDSFMFSKVFNLSFNHFSFFQSSKIYNSSFSFFVLYFSNL